MGPSVLEYRDLGGVRDFKSCRIYRGCVHAGQAQPGVLQELSRKELVAQLIMNWEKAHFKQLSRQSLICPLDSPVK